ncbi:precorrin-2 dehydrogenase/sirohydrochlorin ferrochelatase family protein [Eisenibacter elegans]|jgi:precorrin-2 dehydrogenase/sirohydrochlorin ferrochelatase|uniref:precorrin-2 dehydrogenase/sirohydrochlorin ferrochelatase family protein n=1 Tax=Eisenibacter elegans TaxID=997 RepID=UPI0004193B76|nr:bifunctional precorrin-2 dehydrogenase/sirohydrochlorin ferrochelatase [Eisenibacter elegans]
MNELFPVFLKLSQLQTLLVGGGNVGLEKLSALLRNSPEAQVTLVAPMILDEVRSLASEHPTVTLHQRPYQASDLEGKQLVILATDNPSLHQEIVQTTRQRGILTNVADTPDLCDLYLGSVVQKGDLKVAISTNGKSPTLAKRLREYWEANIPDNVQELLDNLQAYRNTLKGDFAQKVSALNELTKNFTAPQKPED